VSAIKPKVVAFEPGADLLPVSSRRLSSRGTTPGHSGYRIGSGTDSVLVFGDANATATWCLFASPPGKLRSMATRSLERQHGSRSSKAPPRVVQRLYSEHFPFPGIGKIVKGKDGASWQPGRCTKSDRRPLYCSSATGCDRSRRSSNFACYRAIKIGIDRGRLFPACARRPTWFRCSSTKFRFGRGFWSKACEHRRGGGLAAG